jgi:hypothetical protein
MNQNKIDACQTYIEQTKVFVSLASLFVLAPAGLVSVSEAFSKRLANHLFLVWSAESLFIASILLGYLTLGSLAGSQDDGTYDIYRPATRILSVASITSYLVGLILFVKVLAQTSPIG